MNILQTIKGTRMREGSANILFHIRNHGYRFAPEDLEQHMANAQGVQSACISCKHASLMLVDYDPQATSAHSLLFRLQDKGLQAAMVGL